MIFRILISIIVLSTITILARMFIVDRTGIQNTFINIFKPDLGDNSILIKIRKYVFLLSALFFVLLALTGFVPVIFFGTHITGIWLIFHVTLAPLFIASFTLYVILNAHNRRFCLTDFNFLKTISTSKKDTTIQFFFIQKVIFWLFTAVVVPAALSIILQMYPLFDSVGQEFLLNIHRYSTLLLFAASCLYILFILKQKFAIK